jgi:hypothetical protein
MALSDIVSYSGGDFSILMRDVVLVYILGSSIVKSIVNAGKSSDCCLTCGCTHNFSS